LRTVDFYTNSQKTKEILVNITDIKTKEENEANEIVKIDDSIIFENETEVKQIKDILKREKRKQKNMNYF
jgi:hypothetical protein